MKRSILAVLVFAAMARGDRMPDPPLQERLARADLSVLAKVTKIEEKGVELPAAPGAKEKIAFRVATLEVKERFHGKDAAKVVKVAYHPGGRRFPAMNFSAGQTRIFILTKQHGTDYYRFAQQWDIDSSEAPAVTQARKAGKLLSNPMGGLKSKDAGERAQAAGLLVIRYRTRPLAEAKAVKEEPIPAGESKLILETLAEANWDAPGYSQMSPRSLFLRLGLTEKDGWKANLPTLNDDAKKWLKANAGKYRVRRFTTGVTAEP
jgi:hypothetical protein